MTRRTGLEILGLGCVAVGFTIYPGSAHAQTMYEQLREAAEEAKACGLPVVVWSYPRGTSLSKEGESALDVAEGLVGHLGGLRGLADATIEQLSQIRGVGVVKAIEIRAAVELGKRISAARRFPRNEAQAVKSVQAGTRSKP